MIASIALGCLGNKTQYKLWVGNCRTLKTHVYRHFKICFYIVVHVMFGSYALQLQILRKILLLRVVLFSVSTWKKMFPFCFWMREICVSVLCWLYSIFIVIWAHCLHSCMHIYTIFNCGRFKVTDFISSHSTTKFWTVSNNIFSTFYFLL